MFWSAKVLLPRLTRQDYLSHPLRKMLWLTGELEFETSDDDIRRRLAGSVMVVRVRQARGTLPVIHRGPVDGTWLSQTVSANHVATFASRTKQTSRCAEQCLLSGVKRTFRRRDPMSAYDPKRTSALRRCRCALSASRWGGSPTRLFCSPVRVSSALTG